MQAPSMRELLEAGVHFGHQVRRWHPSMKHYIFGARDGVHIIDLAQTEDLLSKAYQFVKNIYSNGGNMIFVGTKNQAQSIIKEAAGKCGGFYITERWIGGLITNFEEVSKNIKKLEGLEEKRKNEEEMAKLTKKEGILIDREIVKLIRLYGGLRGMNKLPDAFYVIDVRREETVCREAKRKEIPVVAICDSNANLDLVTHPIPGNDDSIKSIKIITETIAQAAEEGKMIFEKGEVQTETKEQRVGGTMIEEEEPKKPSVQKASSPGGEKPKEKKAAKTKTKAEIKKTTRPSSKATASKAKTNKAKKAKK
ncbi:30S ribosomal protein S2 [Candidatus Curtissbacteria bacterium RBG_16_39_7]|uniref:Small ribosomal subunit protein uS2 n=1 Tax=Candidatus Curtissbacteria bacterium RBG_16_39_7 TaxID=1797707 RepID=A0A1F5G1U8_9BACT|nr:MAG: 30S ribosomal protein S2 [Candidatus Curtissbacteria bacterium RBG_16_39_7]